MLRFKFYLLKRSNWRSLGERGKIFSPNGTHIGAS